MLMLRDVTIHGALREVNLRVPRGAVVAVLGPHAAGKTILLKAMAGLSAIDGGAIVHDGQTLTTPKTWYPKVGMAFQHNALWDSRTVLDNLLLPLRHLGSEEASRMARRELRSVGLEADAEKLPAQLSGGMQKRLGIARATVSQPTLALFDDPFLGLDPATAEGISQLLLRDREQRVTVIASNDVHTYLDRTDHILLLDRGDVAASGRTGDLLARRDGALAAFLGISES